jgi:ribokinase
MIGVESMLMRENVATSVCVCFVNHSGETSFVSHIADDVAVTSDRVRAAEAVIQQADAVLITFELPLSTIREAIALATRCEAPVFLQPAPPLADLSGYAIIPWNQVHVLVPNKTEAFAILQGVGSDRTNQMDDLAAELAAELTAPAVVVTLEESGCIAYANGSSRRYPAHSAVPIDTTGASDAFVACLAAFMLAGASESGAIEAALAAAAWNIGRPGGHEAMPSLAQLIGMLSQPR